MLSVLRVIYLGGRRGRREGLLLSCRTLGGSPGFIRFGWIGGYGW